MHERWRTLNCRKKEQNRRAEKELQSFKKVNKEQQITIHQLLKRVTELENLLAYN